MVCLLLPLFLLTTFVSLDSKPATATQVALEWGHLCTTPSLNTTEQDLEIWVSNQIDSYFSNGYWTHQNNYGYYTQQWVVNQWLQWNANPANGVNWATTWWVGDFYHPSPPTPGPWGHFACYGEASNDIVDSVVFENANYYGGQRVGGKQYFVFMWTCANGGLYWDNEDGNYQNVNGITVPDTSPPGSPPQYTPNNPHYIYGLYDVSGVVGMPLAWSGTQQMCDDGYVDPAGNFAYIGFENNSPFMGDYPPPGWSTTGLQYKYFAYYFYRYALGIDNGPTHHTIKDSIDYAALMTFGPGYTFGNSVLNQGYWRYSGGWWFCKMRVLGNSLINLPY